VLKGLDKNLKISVIMPAYNEGDHIYRNIQDIVGLFQKLEQSFEIIVVDDASSDNTFREAKRAKDVFTNVIVLKNEINYGKGWSIRKGFSYVTGGYVVFLDADFELDPNQIEHFFEMMSSSKSDVVIGCKRHPQSKIAYPLYRKILSIGYFFLVKRLFGLPIRDTQTGLKVFKYEVLEQVMPKLLIKSFAFDLEILVLAFSFGYKIAEAPVIVTCKKKFGHIGLFSILSILIDTLAIYYRLRILKYYDYPRLKIAKLPKVSILIAVKENNKYLEQALRLCKELNYPDYEIIVLPDKDFSNTDHKVRIIATGSVTPPVKRDIGVKHAQGEILAFLDDDCYPAENWLRQAVRGFSYDDVAAVGGPAQDAAGQSLEQRASGSIFSSQMVSGNYVCRYVPKTLREVDDWPSCNFLVRKSDFGKVNGFSTEFWPGEDTFLCFKLVKVLKKKILYDPEAIVYHYRRPVFLPHLKQISRYALHRGYFARKFPQTSLRINYFLPSIFTIYMLITPLFFIYLNQLLRIIYLGLLLVYFAGLLFTSAKSLNRKIVRLIFAGIPLTHFTYGIFFIKGLLAKRMPEEKG